MSSGLLAILTEIQSVLDAWRESGHRHLSNGAELIGCVSEDGDAWMHALFPPRSPEYIDAVEADIGTKLPSSLRDLFGVHAGMNLFSGSLQIACRSEPVIRVGDHSVHPISIIDLNVQYQSHSWWSPDHVAFGIHGWDQSVLSISPTNIVRRHAPGDGKEMGRWGDVWSFLCDRLTRFEHLTELVDGPSPDGS